MAAAAGDTEVTLTLHSPSRGAEVKRERVESVRLDVTIREVAVEVAKKYSEIDAKQELASQMELYINQRRVFGHLLLPDGCEDFPEVNVVRGDGKSDASEPDEDALLESVVDLEERSRRKGGWRDVEVVVQTSLSVECGIKHVRPLLDDVAAELAKGAETEGGELSRVTNALQYAVWRDSGDLYGRPFFAMGGARRWVELVEQLEHPLTPVAPDEPTTRPDFTDDRSRHYLWICFTWLSVNPDWIRYWVDANIGDLCGRVMVARRRDNLPGEGGPARILTSAYPDALRQMATVPGIFEALASLPDSASQGLVERLRASQPRVKAARAG